MAYETKPLSGSMFVELNKRDPSHADWKGSLKVSEGNEYWVDGYNIIGKNGPSISIELRKKNEKPIKRDKNDKTDLGFLALNPNKIEQKHADRRGRLNIGGKEYWLSAWDNTTKVGDKSYLSLKINEVVAQTPAKEAAWEQPKQDDSSSAVDIGVPLDFVDTPPEF